MMSKYDDENREREGYSWSTKVPFTYLSSAERASLKQCLMNMLSSLTEEVRTLAVGLIFMILSAEKPGSTLVCSWKSRDGEYIDLSRNIYFKMFYLPDDAAKPIDTDLCHQVTSQIISVPISPRLSETLKTNQKFSQCDEFKLGELLPVSASFIWKKLNKLMPRALLKNRKGLSSFYSWIACEVSERGDKSLAYSLMRFESFSSKHATYYPTYQKDQVVNIMCDLQETMFGLPVKRPEFVSGYVGSHLYLKDEVLRDWLDRFYQQFPIDDNWRCYDKQKLERYRNQYVYVVWIALASNFALRYCSAHLINELLNRELIGLVEILDKNVTKVHPERHLPVTTITKNIVRHFCDIDRVIKTRFGLSLKGHQFALVNLKQMNTEVLTTEHVNQELFCGFPFPSNMIRHYMTSKMKERGTGQWAQILLGHRPDVIALPHADILFSPAGGELEEEIAAIQSGVIGLRSKSSKPPRKLQRQIMEDKYGDYLATMLAKTKPLNVLSRMVGHGVKVEKQGECYVWTDGTSFLDFATDEDVALTQFMTEQDLANAVKQALKIVKQHSNLLIVGTEHHRAHIEHYSIACNYLSKDCLASLLTLTPEGECSHLAGHASPMLIQQRSFNAERVLRLISILSKPHKKPIERLKGHLIREFGLSDYKSEEVETLLSLIQSIHDNVEITVYAYMLKKMRERQTSSQLRNIAPTTWATENSKVYQPLLTLMEQVTEVSQLNPDEVKHYRDELYRGVERTNGEDTIRSMEYIINGIFSLMGSEPCYFGYNSKVELKPTEKHLVWPYQYNQVISVIDESDFSLQQKRINRAAVVLMYKAGLRPAELQLITNLDILDSLRVSSNYDARTKTPSGNRVVHFSLTLSEDEKTILKQVVEQSLSNSNGDLFKQVDLSWINHRLKSVTNNPHVSLYCLRYSFANFHYLLLMGVHLPVVQAYFESEDLTSTLGDLKSLWTIKGYENEAMLKALSLTLGHKDVATTMNYYICTLPLVRLYYRLKAPLLTARQVAHRLAMPHTTYCKYKARNTKTVGLGLGTHLLPCTSPQSERKCVNLESGNVGSTYDFLNIKIQRWQKLLGDKHTQGYAVLQKEARNYGLTVKTLSIALKQKTTFHLTEKFAQLPECERQELYEEWLTKCSSKESLGSALVSAGFVKTRNALNLEFRVKERKYVHRGEKTSLNKNIAVALLIVTSKVAEVTPNK